MMVDTQVRPSDVTKFPIIDAMLAIPREAYVPDNKREAAYIGENLTLDEGRVMLEPRTLAKMLEVLDVQPSHVALDVACGLGYSTAILSKKYLRCSLLCFTGTHPSTVQGELLTLNIQQGERGKCEPQIV